MNKISGVYKITNNITGDFYIGSSKNIKARWTAHKKSCTWKHRPNSRLYQAMAKYGKDNFLFEIIEETTELREREQYWIDRLKPTYNIIRANGPDIEGYKEWYKEYREIHRDEQKVYKQEWYIAHREEHLVKAKVWYDSHIEEQKVYHKSWYESHKEEQQSKSRDYYNRLCLYNGKTFTLNNLSQIFRRQGIPHPVLEAKKYLIHD